MSFRDTFTRGSGNEHLQYDDTASMFFVATVLLVVTLWLAIHLLKKVMRPWGDIRGLKEAASNPALKQKVIQFKKERRYSFITFWFVLKVLLFFVLAYFLFATVMEVRESHQNLKGFDPYQILEITESAPPEAIRKAYRRLALIYHPDRNPDDPQAAAKFIMISKAYQCLTNEDARENCEKYGNPDGSNSFNVGIALPSFLVRKQNQVKVMGVVFLILVIIIPLALIYWNSNMNKFDEFGMLKINYGRLYEQLNEQLSIRDASKVLGMCMEFQDTKVSTDQLRALAEMLKVADQDTKALMDKLHKKNYLNWVKRAIMLCDSRLKQVKVPAALEVANTKVMREVPKLVNATVHFMLERSHIQFQSNQQKFMGMTPIQSMIRYEQHFIQGRAHGKPNFQQLDLTDAEVDTLTRKNKGKLTISMLQEDPEKLERFLSVFEPARKQQVKANIFMFPQVTCTTDVFTENEEGITDKDFVTVKITLARKQLSPFAIATRFPFLKQERWYCLLSSAKKVIHFEKFEFDELTKSLNYMHRRHLKAGEHNWTVTVMPDCYYGFDIEQPVRFVIEKESSTKRKSWEVHSQDKAIERSSSFMENIMKSLQKPEDAELSDEEDEDEGDKKDKKESQEAKSQPQQELVAQEQQKQSQAAL